GRICAGSPTAIQPMGTVAPTGTAVFTCTTPLIRTSERAPRRAPLKTLAPVATKTESATGQPERCAWGPTRTWLATRTRGPVVADADRVSGCAPQHGLFHDDAVLSNSNGPAFGDEYRAEQHAALSAYGHVAADGGGGRDVGGFVDVRSLALVFEQHGIPPPLRRVAPILPSTPRSCTAGALPPVHFHSPSGPDILSRTTWDELSVSGLSGPDLTPVTPRIASPSTFRFRGLRSQ